MKNRHWTLTVGCYFTEKLRFVWDILARTLVNYECGAYLAIGHGLVYCSYSKTILIFFSVISSLILVLKTSFSIPILFLSSFYIWTYWNFVVIFLQSTNCSSIFIHNNCYPIQTEGVQLYVLAHTDSDTYIAYVLLFDWFLGLTCQTSSYLGAALFIFSVLPATFSVICSEK